MMVHLKKGCTKGCTTKKIVIRKTLAAKGFAELTQHSNSTLSNHKKPAAAGFFQYHWISD
jgi:hypothetical protein